MPNLSGPERPRTQPNEPSRESSRCRKVTAISAEADATFLKKPAAFQEFLISIPATGQPCQLRIHAFLAKDSPHIAIKAEKGDAEIVVQDTGKDMIELRDRVRADRFTKAHRAKKFKQRREGKR